MKRLLALGLCALLAACLPLKAHADPPVLADASMFESREIQKPVPAAVAHAEIFFAVERQVVTPCLPDAVAFERTSIAAALQTKGGRASGETLQRLSGLV